MPCFMGGSEQVKQLKEQCDVQNATFADLQSQHRNLQQEKARLDLEISDLKHSTQSEVSAQFWPHFHQHHHSAQITFIMKQLGRETEEKTALKVLVQDKDEELRLGQRKHAQSVKDITKQLQLAQRKNDHNGQVFRCPQLLMR